MAAIAAARADIGRNLHAVTPSADKVAGSVLVVIPTRDVIERHGVRRGPSASEESVQFVADVLELGYLGIADWVGRGQVFDRLSVVRSADPEREPIRAFDYKLWLLGQSGDRWQWYLSRRDGDARVPLAVDRGLPRTERGASFNIAVTRAAAGLGGTVSPRGR